MRSKCQNANGGDYGQELPQPQQSRAEAAPRLGAGTVQHRILGPACRGGAEAMHPAPRLPPELRHPWAAIAMSAGMTFKV